jgi:hypothetical protein
LLPRYSNELYNEHFSFVEDIHDKGLFYYYHDPSFLPRDCDTSSFGSLLLYKQGKLSADQVMSLCQNIATNNVHSNGVINTYFDQERMREPDACVLINLSYLFYKFNLEHLI